MAERKIEYIQILGLQCSGTVALEKLIRANTDVTVGEHGVLQEYGGKHGKLLKWEKIKSAKDALFVYIQKDIDAWVVSMRNRPHGCFPVGLSLMQAMKHRWHTPAETYDNMLDMRAEMLSRYKRIRELVSPNWRSFKHDELIKNPSGILASLGVELKPTLDLSCLSRYKGVETYQKFDPTAYLNKKYKDEYTEEEMRHLMENSDKDMENLLV